MDFLASPWGFGSITVAALALLAIVWKVGNVSLSKSGILIGKNPPQPNLSPHATCPHAGDIMTLIHRTTEYMEKKQELKYQLLEDQMRFYEETEEELASFLKKNFLKMLEAKLAGTEAFVQHPEYMAYIVTLKALSAEIKPYIRNCFKANHYAELSPEEQRNYIDKRKEVIMSKATELLNLYWRGRVVTREELYSSQKDHIADIGEYIEEIFNRAFALARATAEELEYREDSYNDYITNTLGDHRLPPQPAPRLKPKGRN